MAALSTIVAANIRAERARHGWRQAQLAERLGVGEYTVSDIETGRRTITLDDLPLLCRALDVTLAELMRRADEGDRQAMGL